MRVAAAVEDGVEDGNVADDAVRCDPVDLGIDPRRTHRPAHSACVRLAVLAEGAAKGAAALRLPADEALRLDDAGEER